MKRPAGLWIKISLVAFLNFFLLITVFFVVARVQYRMDLSSFLLAPARDRMVSASQVIALEVESLPREKWDAVLEQYSKTYPAEIFLFDRDGSQLAGKVVQPPQSLFPPHRGPPPRDFERGFPPPDQAPPPPEERRESPFQFEHVDNPSLYWASVRTQIPSVPGERPLDARVIWRFSSLWTNTFFFDYQSWLFTVGIILLISGVCWFPLIRSITKSITAMTKATGQIAGGHFEVQLPVDRNDELGRLSESINQMTHRLSGHVNGQKRFLGDIAHELCSPIARIQLSLGILQQRSDDSLGPYVSTIDDEVQHMSSLVNELLSFSKASLGVAAALENVNVSAVVARAIEREKTGDAHFRVDVPESLTVRAQPDNLFRSISNVLRNAIRYAGADGPIEVSASRQQSVVVITVADYGPGVPPQELSEILKPFYRPETARQRETGGAGLGLAIVNTCMNACGGEVLCRNRVPKGFEVEMRVPLA